MGACSSKNAVKKAPSDDSSTDRESLFTAVETDDEQSVAKLLKHIDVDARDSNEYTALILAAETGATKSVGTLLKAGADYDARDSFGRSAVYAAAVGGKDAAVEKLLAAGASPTNADRDGRGPFWAACATRDTKIAARLLQAGADVDEQDNNGVTALRYAVAHGNADVAEFLRAHGAAEVEGGRLSISPSAAGTEVPETFTNPSPRSAGEASAGAASL